jgi:hypothetical protein
VLFSVRFACPELTCSARAGILDSELGELVYGTKVQTLTDDGKGGEGERSAVLAKTLINAAGLK